jgi:hypothetical protein
MIPATLGAEAARRASAGGATPLNSTAYVGSDVVRNAEAEAGGSDTDALALDASRSRCASFRRARALYSW